MTVLLLIGSKKNILGKSQYIYCFHNVSFGEILAVHCIFQEEFNRVGASSQLLVKHHLAGLWWAELLLEPQSAPMLANRLASVRLELGACPLLHQIELHTT